MQCSRCVLVCLVIILSVQVSFCTEVNVNDGTLEVCSSDPMTGYYRTGICSTGPTDSGTHTVCAVMDDTFLDFTKSQGNDLSTPRGSFPGLKSGDRWCLCALRWREALSDGKAPKVIEVATNKKTLEYVTAEQIQSNALA